MKYNNLKHLLSESSSTLGYFLSLPVETQIELHGYNNHIHTAAELHRYVNALEKYHRQVQLSEYFLI